VRLRNGILSRHETHYRARIDAARQKLADGYFAHHLQRTDCRDALAPARSTRLLYAACIRLRQLPRNPCCYDSPARAAPKSVAGAIFMMPETGPGAATYPKRETIASPLGISSVTPGSASTPSAFSGAKYASPDAYTYSGFTPASRPRSGRLPRPPTQMRSRTCRTTSPLTGLHALIITRERGLRFRSFSIT